MSAPAPPTTSGSNRLLDVEKLENDGKNYTSWVFGVHLVLKLRQLWGQIEGPNSSPPNPITEEWLAKDEKAYLQIVLTLSDDPLHTIYDTTTAKDAWNALADRYRGKGIQSVGYLFTKLWQIKMTVDVGMEEQINEKKAVVEDIKIQYSETRIKDQFTSEKHYPTIPNTSPIYPQQLSILPQELTTLSNNKKQETRRLQRSHDKTDQTPLMTV
jgi:hypothetical protein